jgi:hypothetical protein
MVHAAQPLDTKGRESDGRNAVNWATNDSKASGLYLADPMFHPFDAHLSDPFIERMDSNSVSLIFGGSDGAFVNSSAPVDMSGSSLVRRASLHAGRRVVARQSADRRVSGENPL